MKRRLADGSALDTSYLFSGGHGQGKTTLGRILARAALCERLNKADPEPCNECDNCQAILLESPGAFVEMDAASGGTADMIRGIVEELPFAVVGAPKRIYLFDEAHRMSVAGQDILLKPIEERDMVAIFCTTEPSKIRGAIKSRCEEYTIRKVTRDDLLAQMRKVLQAEGVAYEDDAVLTVIDHSGGHVRDILRSLEMVAQTGKIDLEAVREHLDLGMVTVYYDILLALGDGARALDLVEQAAERVSAESIAAGLAEAAMNSYRLAHKMFADFVYVDRARGEQVYARFGLGTLKLAEFFLARHHPTKVTLLCEVLSLGGGVPAPMPAIALPPPVVAAPPPPPAAAPVAVAAAPVAAPPPPAAPKAEPPKPAPQASGPDVRPDGIGPKGQDNLALTELDHKAIPVEKPRGPGHKAQVVNYGKASDDTEVLHPAAFQREFAEFWRRR